MAEMKKELTQNQTLEPNTCLPSTEQDSCVSISGSLGLNIKLEGSPFFLSHQENQLKVSMTKIENEIQEKVDQGVNASQKNRVEAIGDMILEEMGIAKKSAALNLKPQYSSDFLSFSVLQKEIDEKCLRKAPGQFNQVDESDEILDELLGADFFQF